jgi:hypothetical protein
MLNRNVIKLALIILLLTNGVVYAADTPKIVSEFDVKQDQSLTEAEWDAMSQAAAYVIIHTHQASDYIQKKNTNMALQEVKDALNLIAIIENTMPTYTIDSKINAGDKTHENKYTIRPSEVIIYDEFGEFSILEHVKREKVKRLRENTGKRHTDNISDLGLYDIISILDVTLAKADLENAKQDLELKNLDEADQFLSDVQDGVRFEVDVSDIKMNEKRNKKKIVL